MRSHVTLYLQSALEQLVSVYGQLNQALRAEKKLYQSLSHVQSAGDRLGPEIARFRQSVFKHNII